MLELVEKDVLKILRKNMEDIKKTKTKTLKIEISNI